MADDETKCATSANLKILTNVTDGSLTSADEISSNLFVDGEEINKVSPIPKDLYDLDIIDGFAFVSFDSIEELDKDSSRHQATTTTINLSNGDVLGSKPKQTKKKRDTKKRVKNRIMTEINDDGLKTDFENNEIISSSPSTTTIEKNAVDVIVSNKSSQSTSTQVDQGISMSILPIKRENNHCADVGTLTSFPSVSSEPLINKCVVNTSTSTTTSTIVNGDKCEAAVKHKLMENDDVDDRPPSAKCLKLNGVENEMKFSSIASIPSRYRVISPLTVHGSLTNGVPLSSLNRTVRLDHSMTTATTSNQIHAQLLSPKKEIIHVQNLNFANCNGAPSVSPVPTMTPTLSLVNSSSRPTPSSSTTNFDRKSSSSSTISAGFTALPTASATAPTYFHTEMHQHQHTHMHHYAPPILPPFHVEAPVNGATPACVFGLPTYTTSLPALPVVPPSTLRAPAVPTAGTLAANSLPDFQIQKPRKKGIWCAMHVQIAWDIHNNRTKVKSEKQVEQLIPPTSSSAMSKNIPAALNIDKSSRCSTSAHNHNKNSISTANSKIKSYIATTSSSSLNHKLIEPQHSNFAGFTQDNRNERIESRTSSSNSSSVRETTPIRSRLDKEKQNMTGRSESRGGSSSVRITPLPTSASTTILDKERQMVNMISSGFVDPRNFSVQFPSSNGTSTAPVTSSTTTTTCQDGLLFRQKEFQDRVQANSLAAALFRPGMPTTLPFPFVQDNQMMSNVAVIQSQLNALQQQSNAAADLYRLRLTLPTANNFDQQVRGNLIDAANAAAPRAAMLPLTDPTPMNNGRQMISEQERNQLQQQQILLQRLQQQQQQTPTSTAAFMNRNGSTVNPLASLINSERTMNRVIGVSGIVPGSAGYPPTSLAAFGGGVAGMEDLSFDSPGALALYSNLIRERMEFEQRARLFGLPPQAFANNNGPSTNEMFGFPFLPTNAPSAAADQLAAARNFARFNAQQQQQQQQMVNSQFPLNVNGAAAALGFGVFPSQTNANKLNNSPFSTTLQQMARRGNDLLMNALATTPSSHSLQNRML